MAEAPSRASGNAGRTTGDVSNESTDWESIAPINVDYEDALNATKVANVWQTMYREAGLRSPNEQTQKSFRLAVYTYGAKNGTSREGSYSGTITMSNGMSFEAAVIVRAAGKMTIRKFFRGNMEESYQALKKSKVLERDERFVAKVAEFGVGAEQAFATADWFSNCPYFTPAEKIAHEVVFRHSLTRARRNRMGHNLEDVEQSRLQSNLDAQGALDAPYEQSTGKVSF